MAPKNEVTYERKMLRSPSGMIGILSYTHLTTAQLQPEILQFQPLNSKHGTVSFFARVHAHACSVFPIESVYCEERLAHDTMKSFFPKSNVINCFSLQ